MTLIILYNHFRGYPEPNVYVELTNRCSDQEVQLDMLSFKSREKKRNLAKAIDDTRGRFGFTALLKVSSLTEAGIALD
jgi:hypothetical protein